MEKGKNINIELTEEDLRIKLQRLKQEVQKIRERRIEVEIATAVVQAANAALDAELAAKMARYAIINEETATMRKKHDVFNKEMTRGSKRYTKKVLSSIQKPIVAPNTLALELLKKKLGRKLSISLLSRDEHPYFTRSKGPADSFPGQNSQKGKSTMGDNVEDTNLTDVVVAQPIVADQNELIMQLMQQIAEMRVEIQRRQDSPNPALVPADGRPLLHFPPSNTGQTQNPPPSPAHNPSIVDLTPQNPQYASASYQTPPPPPNTNLQVPVPPQNANPQTGPPPQSQHINNLHTSFRHQNQHTNPQNFPQNYRVTPNAQSPSIAPPLP
ncbi:hypothetical protein R3W88_025088 [Solanum pinnatisectum]|uniref:Uncharacterized protein n=1 Tax=Solanum pinnatisectum TaxID=50273 RepID=A0AAV9M202_9SOLN|nr:hypothetical protein R3W88_025088 [Solanum pinnatisectum]